MGSRTHLAFGHLTRQFLPSFLSNLQLPNRTARFLIQVLQKGS
jgi:hypothetical protein